MIKAVRIAGAVAAAALLMTGCGSDSDDGGDKPEASKKAPSAEQSSAPAEGGAGGKVAGAYVSKSGGEALFLSISGEKAALVAGKHTCTGEYAEMGNKMLMLDCADGNTDRTMGKVTPSADGKTLKVSWDAGLNDTFTKVTTPADIPTGFPTDLPGLESVGGVTGG
ncbi:hypothetical protein [Streptomyces sparsogenes]|uniref:Lipoprotein n=1 Tax=Streptomyces sparsogenes DSM 40356 TaxID=1331668 RepID=A0A1R1SLW1_9ACTN|nr:hypothetical protein [Streptomyces sparsogenes]OMI39298.1 hypothetical protein SPAR_11640 [Streptomyces sparsogenes DSM 40356]